MTKDEIEDIFKMSREQMDTLLERLTGNKDLSRGNFKEVVDIVDQFGGMLEAICRRATIDIIPVTRTLGPRATAIFSAGMSQELFSAAIQITVFSHLEGLLRDGGIEEIKAMLMGCFGRSVDMTLGEMAEELRNHKDGKK